MIHIDPRAAKPRPHPGLTHGDILVRILSEATGKPPALIHHLLDTIRVMLPGGTRLDEVLPPDEAAELLAGLRSELPGIRAWLVRGAAGVRA